MITLTLQRKLHGYQGLFTLNLSLSVPEKGILGIMGPSGAGKTSILKMVAGLMKPDAGLIKVGEQVWLDSERKIYLQPQERKTGFVFQNYALFPNMTVAQNLRFALGNNRKNIIDEMLELFSLTGLKNIKPEKLSGGQQQRVALARAMVRNPDLLLLDEPFSALDESMRTRLQEDLLKLHRQYNFTTIIVSHSSTEISRVTDQVIILEDGKVTYQGDPEEKGMKKLIEGVVTAKDLQKQELKLKVSVADLEKIKEGHKIRIQPGDSSSDL